MTTTSKRTKELSTTAKNARRRTRRKFEATVKESGLLRLFELAPELKAAKESIMNSLFYLFMKAMFYGGEMMSEAYDTVIAQSNRRPNIGSLLTKDGAAADPL